MTPLAVGTAVAVLAIIGLVVGLVVLFVVIWLLQGVLSPLRKVSADLKTALEAPMIKGGVKGTEQLSQTRQLAESVPNLALAYLQKLSLGGSRPAPPPAPAAPSAPAPYSPPSAAPSFGGYAGTSVVEDQDDPRLPAWKRRS